MTSHHVHVRQFRLQPRSLLAKVLIGALAVLSVAAAGVLAIAALAVSAIIAIGAGLVWIVARVFAPRDDNDDNDGDPRDLEARKGPQGWTVDAPGR